MRLLLDECVPRKLKFAFVAGGHECATAREAGFEGKTNGELLASAELLFDVLITIDQNIPHQQNLRNRPIAILILCAKSNDISDLSPLIPSALEALKMISPGQIVGITTQ